MLRLIALPLLVSLSATPAPVVVPGEPASPLAGVRWIRGTPVDTFAPGRVYVIEIWSTWCGACVSSIPKMNDRARRYDSDATFIALHVWQRKDGPPPDDFMVWRSLKRQPVFEFPVAEAHGPVESAWLDAANSGLPTALILDRNGRLAWIGHSDDLEAPLREIIAGTWDLPRAVARMNLRRRAGRLADASSTAISNSDFHNGIALMLRAFDANPEAAAAWLPSTYGHLLACSNSREVAAGFVHLVTSTDRGDRPDVLAGFAHVILHFRPAELRDLDLALALAQRADELTAGAEPAIIRTLARVHVARGDTPAAVARLEAALRSAYSDEADCLLSTTLADLRAAEGAPNPAASSPAAQPEPEKSPAPKTSSPRAD